MKTIAKTVDKFLISIDLDGTLLKTLSRGIETINKTVVKELHAAGHIVILATGRPVEGCINIYQWMEMIYPIICNSGSTIYSKNQDSLIPMKIFPFKSVALKKLINISQIRNEVISVMFQNTKGFFVTKINEKLLQFTLVEKFFKFTECNINELPLENTYSVAFLFEQNIEMDLLIEKIHNIENNYFHAFEVRVGKIFDANNKHKNGFRLLDVIVANNSKAQSIDYLRKKYKICKKNVIVFGDSDNDISSLKKFHSNSVAMKNASINVKKSARYETIYDNNQGGVGKYLAKLFNLKSI